MIPWLRVSYLVADAILLGSFRVKAAFAEWDFESFQVIILRYTWLEFASLTHGEMQARVPLI